MIKAGPARVLSGLKEIAGELAVAWARDVSVYTVWRCYTSNHDPLPVWIMRRRVFADLEAVRAWAGRQPMWRSR